jgi:hypothetical protein
MSRTVKKLNGGRFEFATTRVPKVETHTLVDMYERVQMCDQALIVQQTIKSDWEAKIAEAEALDGRV